MKRNIVSGWIIGTLLAAVCLGWSDGLKGGDLFGTDGEQMPFHVQRQATREATETFIRDARWTQTAALRESYFAGHVAGEMLGSAVAAGGDVNGDGYDDMIVGADHNDALGSETGRAYVYFGGSPFDGVADVILTGESSMDHFGQRLAITGDLNGDGFDDVVVSAHDYGSWYAGRVYIYFGGEHMDDVADLVMTGEVDDIHLGISVADLGDVNGDGYVDLGVGAYYHNAGSYRAGRAYIYYGGPGFDNTPDVVISGEAAEDWLGYSMTGAGDVNGDGYCDVLIGAFGSDVTASNSGRAYLFLGGSAMDNTPDLVFNGVGANDYFGIAVRGGGDVNGDGYSDIMISGRTNDAAGTNAGRVAVFFGGSEMDSTVDQILWGTAANDLFGDPVANAGDINGDGYSDIIVGAPMNDAGASAAGRAYIYLGGPAFDNIPDALFTGTQASEILGTSVCGNGDIDGNGYADVLVGAPQNNAEGTYAGRAYVYLNSFTGTDIPDEYFTGTAASDFFGYSVASAGDVNGDGYSDVIVGAYFNGPGRACIYLGGASMDATADVTFTGTAEYDYFGYSVASAGDVNGDGYGDVIVGAYLNEAGRACIYFGGTSMDATADVTLTGAAGGDKFGISVASAGDVNGDGYSDVIVGSSGNGAGRAYIFFGGMSMDATLDVTLTGAAVNDEFGCSVASAGDVNGDGYSDVIVGAYLNDAGGSDAGRAYIFFGGVSMDATADVTLTGEAAGDRFGASVASAGDVNGDGYSDMIVGAFYNDYGGSNAGRAYVFFGGVSVDATADATLTGKAADDWFGRSVSSARDVNGDGYSDVIVGAYHNDGGGTDAGRAYIYFGGVSVDATADVTLTGAAAGDNFGTSVASADDVNGDGYSDVIVGAHLNDAGGSNAGRAYLYLSTSPLVRPRITGVVDVPDDQGGAVIVKWVRCGYDSKGTGTWIDYTLERSSPPGVHGYDWVQLGTIAGLHRPIYNYLATTSQDSSNGGSGTYYFRVIARMPSQMMMWTSTPVSGHSIDNLAPDPPGGGTLSALTSAIRVSWRKNDHDPDVKQYAIYRSPTSGFSPDQSTRLAATPDTCYTDTSAEPDESYYYVLRTEDIHGNLSTPTPEMSLSFTQALASGWNMLSLPGDVPLPCYMSLYPSSVSGTLYEYTGTYFSTDTLKLGTGYWLKSTGAASATTNGSNVPSLSLPLRQGWNMTGSIGQNIPLSSVVDAGGILVPGTLYGFNGAYVSSDSIKRGEGYWIRTTAAGTIVLNGSGAPKARGREVLADLSSLPAIEISDASGATQTLYAGVALNNPETRVYYSLPPVPPVGCFDVRFTDDSRITDTEEAMVFIQASDYPLTVTGKNLGSNENAVYEVVEMVGGKEGQKYVLNEGVPVRIVNDQVRQLNLVAGREIPLVFALEQNYPNPFNPKTEIRYTVPGARGQEPGFSTVKLMIYDLLGRDVVTLVNEEQKPGVYTVTFDATALASGVYVYRLTAGTNTDVKKMVYLK